MKIAGKTVVDAKRPLTLHITEADVRQGKEKTPSACAAARAAMREIPNAISARVHLAQTYVEFPRRWVRYGTPESLSRKITAFDLGGKFEPGDHTLRMPYGSKKLGRNYKEGQGKKTNTRNHRRPIHLTGVRASPYSNMWGKAQKPVSD